MNLTLATRIFLGYATVILSFGAVSVYSIVEMRAIGVEIRLVSDGYLPLAKITAAIESFQNNRQRDTSRLLNEQVYETRKVLLPLARPYFAQEVRKKLESAAQKAHESLQVAPRSEREFLANLDQRLAELERLYQDYEAASNALFLTLEDPGPPNHASEPARAVVSLERRIERDIKTLGMMLDQRVADRVKTAEQRESRAAWAIVALSLCAIGLGLSATFAAGRLLAPLRPLTAAVTRIGMGDYSAEVPLAARDEVGVLAREFNAMAKALRERERQLEEKQQALVRAERLAAIGRISAQITHEVRNPLSAIGLNAEMLEEAVAQARFPAEGQGEEALELVRAIVREADRLEQITEQYLNFARFPKPVLAPADPNALIDSLLGFLEEEHTRAGVTLQRALEPGCPPIVCDEAQLRRALMNLLRNSREALVHGGTIRLETRPQVTHVELVVADDGPGIPPAEVERIFDPFFSTKERGTGLGLALTQQIIHEHGGEIRCESELGKGTRFVLRLRRATPA